MLVMKKEHAFDMEWSYLFELQPCRDGQRGNHGRSCNRDRCEALDKDKSAGKTGRPAEFSILLGISSLSSSNTPLKYKKIPLKCLFRSSKTIPQIKKEEETVVKVERRRRRRRTKSNTGKANKTK